MRTLVIIHCLCIVAYGIRAKRETAEEEETTYTAREAVTGDETTTTTTSTTAVPFVVERLDAPMERIEIRLIDDNRNTSADTVEVFINVLPNIPNQTPLRFEVEVSPKSVESAGLVVQVVNNDHIIHENNSAKDEYTEKYKKAEYMSDLVHVNVVEDVSTTHEIPSTEASTEMKEVDEPPKPTLGFGIPSSFPKTPLFDSDSDDVALPPEIEQTTQDDNEPEPVEECLKNRQELSLEVVEDLTLQVQRLARIIKKLNKLQMQYCVDITPPIDVENADQYRQCILWREEKMVHYYKLMRLSYCQDYEQWPNAPRIKRQYAGHLHLFETLYAFQKP